MNLLFCQYCGGTSFISKIVESLQPNQETPTILLDFFGFDAWPGCFAVSQSARGSLALTCFCGNVVFLIFSMVWRFAYPGRKMACASICHSKAEASFLSSLLSTKLFSMARNGEYKIQAFPDVSGALSELKQFQRSPQPEYQVCVSTGEGHLIIRESLLEFWTQKHASFADQVEELLKTHNNEFNPRGLKRGAEECNGNEDDSSSPPSKRLRLDNATKLSDLEGEFPDRSLLILAVSCCFLFSCCFLLAVSFGSFLRCLNLMSSIARIVLNAGSFALHLCDAALWVGCSAASITIEANTELFGFGSGEFAKGSEGADMMSDTSAEGRWLRFHLESGSDLVILEKQRQDPEHLQNAAFFNKAGVF